MSDERDFLCNYYLMTTDPSGRIRFYDPSEKPLRMVDIYQALLFGGRYRYAFAGAVSDDSSRFIAANKFVSCVDDKQTKARLNVTYYWTADGNCSQYISNIRRELI